MSLYIYLGEAVFFCLSFVVSTQPLEHYRPPQQTLKQTALFLVLVDLLGHELCLFVETAEHLRTDPPSASLLSAT